MHRKVLRASAKGAWRRSDPIPRPIIRAVRSLTRDHRRHKLRAAYGALKDTEGKSRPRGSDIPRLRPWGLHTIGKGREDPEWLDKAFVQRRFPMRGEALTTTLDLDAALGIGPKSSKKRSSATEDGPARVGRKDRAAGAAAARGDEEEGSDASGTYEAFDFEVDTDESAEEGGDEAAASRGSPRGPSHREALENVVSQRRSVKKAAPVAGEEKGKGRGAAAGGGDRGGDGAGGEPTITYDPRMTLAYLSQRALPAFASARAVMTEVQARMADFNPETVLDFGAGAGSAAAASRSVWDTVGEVTAVEPSQSMTEALRTVLGADVADLRVRRSLTQLLPHVTGQETPQHDLVLAHHVLTDLPDDGARATAVALLWRMLRPGGVIVISEFGDAFGSHTVRCARQMLIDESARLQNQLREEVPALLRARALPMEPRLRGAELKMALRSALRDRAKARGVQVDVNDLVGQMALSAARLPVGSMPAEARAAHAGADAGAGERTRRGAAAGPDTAKLARGKSAPAPKGQSIVDTIKPTDPPERFMAALAEEQGARRGAAPGMGAAPTRPGVGAGLGHEYEYVYEEEEEEEGGGEGGDEDEALLDEVELTGLEEMSEETEAQVMALTEEELSALPHAVAGQIREVQRRVTDRSGRRGGGSGPARGLHTCRTLQAPGGAGSSGRGMGPEPEYEYVYEEVPSDEEEEEAAAVEQASAAPATEETAEAGDKALMRIKTAELQRTVEAAMGISEAESFTVPRAVVIAPCTHQHSCPLQGRPLSCATPLRVPHHTKGFEVHPHPHDFPFQTVSYVAIMKSKGPTDAAARALIKERNNWSRVIHSPKRGHRHVKMHLCTPQGVEESRVVSRGKLKHVPGAYSAARKAVCGGLWHDLV